MGVTKTTITISKDSATITTDIDTAKKLLSKNSSCSSKLRGENVTLVYPMRALNTLTSLIKSYKL